MLVGEVFARMGLDSKQYEKSLDRLENVTKKRALTLGNIFKGALSVTIGMTMFEAVKRGFQVVVGESISFNAQMEQARIGFTTMLGSAERAEAFLRDMADFAARTPFEFPELLDASKRMLAYGFAAEDVLPTMEAVGNASAAVGLGTEGINRIILALGQMRAKGKLSAEEMRQLTETGIPAWEILAEAMNKTTAEIMDMQSKGLIPADRAIKMLVEGMNKRFPDMMKNMENTWEGVTSTIKDIWQMTIGALTSSLFEGLKTWLQGVRDWAVDFYDTFQKYGLQRAISESFGPEVAALVSVLGAVMRGLASVVKAVTGFFVQYGKQIKFVAIVMGTYLALTKAVTLAKQLMITVTAIERGQLLAKIPILNVVSTAMGIYRVQMALAAQQGIVLTGVLAKLRVALFALWSALGPVGWIMLGIAGAVGVGTHLWGKYTQSVYSGAKIHDELATSAGQVEGSASDAVGAIEDEADALKKAGKAAGKNIQSFDEVHQLQEDMAGSAEDLTDVLGIDAPEIGGFEIPDIEAQLEEMKPTLKGFWEWIKQGAGNLWESVKQKWSDFVNWVKSWDVWDWLGQKWESLKNLANTTWTGIADVVSTAWNGIVNATQTIWLEVWNLLQTYWNNTVALVKNVFGAIWSFIKGTWDNIRNTTVSIWSAVWGFLKNQWETIKTFGGNIFGILRDLILGKIDLRTAISLIWNEIKTFLSNTWTNIKTLGENIWSALSNFLITQWELLKELVITIWIAIKDFLIGNWEATKEAVINIWTAIRNFLSDTWEAIKTTASNIWTAILDFLGINWEETKRKAAETWANIKQTISDRWNELKDSAGSIWDSIKTTIINSWDELKNRVGPTWNDIKTTIANKWREIKDDAFTWGKNLIESFINGIKNKISDLKSAIGNIGETIKSALTGGSKSSGGGGGGGGGSGGGSTLADQAQASKDYYAANKEAIDKIAREKGVDLGVAADMLKFGAVPKMATGTNYVPRDMLAFLHEGEAVVPKAYNPAAGGGLTAEQVEQAVYRAFVSAMRIVQASSQQGDSREIVLKIDNTVLARMQLPALSREAQRQGFDLLIRPQGV